MSTGPLSPESNPLDSPSQSGGDDSSSGASPGKQRSEIAKHHFEILQRQGPESLDPEERKNPTTESAQLHSGDELLYSDDASPTVFAKLTGGFSSRFQRQRPVETVYNPIQADSSEHLRELTSYPLLNLFHDGAVEDEYLLFAGVRSSEAAKVTLVLAIVLLASGVMWQMRKNKAYLPISMYVFAVFCLLLAVANWIIARRSAKPQRSQEQRGLGGFDGASDSTSRTNLGHSGQSHSLSTAEVSPNSSLPTLSVVGRSRRKSLPIPPSSERKKFDAEDSYRDSLKMARFAELSVAMGVLAANIIPFHAAAVAERCIEEGIQRSWCLRGVSPGNQINILLYLQVVSLRLPFSVPLAFCSPLAFHFGQLASSASLTFSSEVGASFLFTVTTMVIALTLALVSDSLDRNRFRTYVLMRRKEIALRRRKEQINQIISLMLAGSTVATLKRGQPVRAQYRRSTVGTFVMKDFACWCSLQWMNKAAHALDDLFSMFDRWRRQSGVSLLSGVGDRYVVTVPTGEVDRLLFLCNNMVRYSAGLGARARKLFGVPTFVNVVCGVATGTLSVGLFGRRTLYRNCCGTAPRRSARIADVVSQTAVWMCSETAAARTSDLIHVDALYPENLPSIFSLSVDFFCFDPETEDDASSTLEESVGINQPAMRSPEENHQGTAADRHHRPKLVIIEPSAAVPRKSPPPAAAVGIDKETVSTTVSGRRYVKLYSLTSVSARASRLLCRGNVSLDGGYAPSSLMESDMLSTWSLSEGDLFSSVGAQSTTIRSTDEGMTSPPTGDDAAAAIPAAGGRMQGQQREELRNLFLSSYFSSSATDEVDVSGTPENKSYQPSTDSSNSLGGGKFTSDTRMRGSSLDGSAGVKKELLSPPSGAGKFGAEVVKTILGDPTLWADYAEYLAQIARESKIIPAFMALCLSVVTIAASLLAGEMTGGYPVGFLVCLLLASVVASSLTYFHVPPKMLFILLNFWGVLFLVGVLLAKDLWAIGRIPWIGVVVQIVLANAAYHIPWRIAMGTMIGWSLLVFVINFLLSDTWLPSLTSLPFTAALFSLLTYTREKQRLQQFVYEHVSQLLVRREKVELEFHWRVMDKLLPPYVIPTVIERALGEENCITDRLSDTAALFIRFPRLEEFSFTQELENKLLLGGASRVRAPSFPLSVIPPASERERREEANIKPPFSFLEFNDSALTQCLNKTGKVLHLVRCVGDTAYLAGPLQQSDDDLIQLLHGDSVMINDVKALRRRTNEEVADAASLAVLSVFAELNRIADSQALENSLWPHRPTMVAGRGDAVAVVLGHSPPRFDLTGWVAHTTQSLLSAAPDGFQGVMKKFHETLPIAVCEREADEQEARASLYRDIANAAPGLDATWRIRAGSLQHMVPLHPLPTLHASPILSDS